jgi:hypothetical protein
MTSYWGKPSALHCFSLCCDLQELSPNVKRAIALLSLITLFSASSKQDFFFITAFPYSVTDLSCEPDGSTSQIYALFSEDPYLNLNFHLFLVYEKYV